MWIELDDFQLPIRVVFGPSEVRASVEQLRYTTIFGIFPPSFFTSKLYSLNLYRPAAAASVQCIEQGATVHHRTAEAATVQWLE